MKDLPHHMNKLNRKVIRSVHREEAEEEQFDMTGVPPRKQSEKQKKKQAKAKVKKERDARAPTPRTPEEQNRIMKTGRVPIFDRNNAKPKASKPSQKKTPPI